MSTGSLPVRVSMWRQPYCARQQQPQSRSKRYSAAAFIAFVNAQVASAEISAFFDRLRLVEVKDGLAWYPAPPGLRLRAVEAGSVLTPLTCVVHGFVVGPLVPVAAASPASHVHRAFTNGQPCVMDMRL